MAERVARLLSELPGYRTFDAFLDYIVDRVTDRVVNRHAGAVHLVFSQRAALDRAGVPVVGADGAPVSDGWRAKRAAEEVVRLRALLAALVRDSADTPMVDSAHWLAADGYLRAGTDAPVVARKTPSDEALVGHVRSCSCDFRSGRTDGRCAVIQSGAGAPVPEVDDATGFHVAPSRYMAHGRETIDRIRDALGDEGFAAYCLGAAMKYEDRAGLKGPAEEDMQKARWYRQMHDHVTTGTPDPRSYRKG